MFLFGLAFSFLDLLSYQYESLAHLVNFIPKGVFRWLK